MSLDETETRRGGTADGRCMRKGCDRPVPEGGVGGNVFYCSDVCGRLANPENPVYAAMRDGDLKFVAHLDCPCCGGTGWVLAPCPRFKESDR